ncbi:luciferin sulfotransferase-like [Hyalella azteca]|uniref:Luciferin sulfotransferase-like n=1 Tax=Hyalella azteca TaxID=294128 RepID=A0A8B7P1R8_HYAAZ|nr:luciferin sulfotransferase-like [Hyalella azteca]
MAETEDENSTPVTEMEFKDYSGPELESLQKYLPVYQQLVEVVPSSTLMPATYKKYHDQYQRFQSRPTDVWIASHPKAGTTWTQEMVWCLLYTLQSPRLTELLPARSPFFEWDSLFPDWHSMEHLPDDDVNKTGVMWDILTKTLPDPRNIKTHVHWALLPPSVHASKAKIVYVCRDPRDLCVSYYYHHIKLEGYTGDFDTFVKIFLADALPWGPFWSNVLSYWQRRHQPNVFFFTFEQLKKDLPGTLLRLAEFLGIKRGGSEGALGASELAALTEHLSFSSMSTNPATNNEVLAAAAINPNTAGQVKFMRQGKVGDHASHLSAQQLQQFKKWTEEALKDSDFPYYRNYE